MSINYNPTNNTTGLILSMDAGNKKSYPGTGNTWYDLMGNQNGVATPGVPAYNSTDGGGCFDFAANAGLNGGTATCGFNWTDPIPTTGSYTFSCWVKNVPPSVGQGVLFNNSASAPGYRFGVGADGIYYLSGYTYNEGYIAYTSTFTNTQWNHIVLVYDRSGSLANGSPYYYG